MPCKFYRPIFCYGYLDEVYDCSVVAFVSRNQTSEETPLRPRPWGHSRKRSKIMYRNVIWPLSTIGNVVQWIGWVYLFSTIPCSPYGKLRKTIKEIMYASSRLHSAKELEKKKKNGYHNCNNRTSILYKFIMYI